MLQHDTTRQVGLFSFIEKRGNADRSGWFLDYFFNTITTDDEKLSLRDYIRGNSKPLLYVGACLPPNLVKAPEETLNLTELTFPTIKAEAKITGCDVDEGRLNTRTGEVIPVGMQRYTKEVNRQMAALLEGLRATHISEAINMLKSGGYVLNSVDGDIGTVDFNRDATLKNIDLTGTDEDWSKKCSKPMKTVEAIVRQMSRCGAAASVVDIVHSDYAFQWLEAHDEREAVKYDRQPIIPKGLQESLYFGYDDVIFKGTTNGGKVRHWVNFAKYVDHTGAEVDVLDAGEIMIVNRNGFGGTRAFRTVTSDNREFLPAGAQFFLYDDLEKEYNRKCRSYSPWLEEYHLMLAKNVNAAVTVKVVDPTSGEPCIECETC